MSDGWLIDHLKQTADSMMRVRMMELGIPLPPKEDSSKPAESSESPESERKEDDDSRP